MSSDASYGGGPPSGSGSHDSSASASMSSASSSSIEPDPLIGTTLDGRYRVVDKLGEGGMGEVYAAEHVHIEKRVAIKLLRKEILENDEAVSRFRQEARSASSIGHENIIAIEDFGALKDGRIYLCMELLDGQPLNDMIEQPMAPDRLLNILIQTGHGLAAAHAKGIVHRDMKPENIFVTQKNGQDVPKLLDFGIAKVSQADGNNNLTRTGTIFGTPFYMAPEQALGQGVDQRVDVYAMGVIMYEVFCGQVPFEGESFMGILTQHITAEPTPPAQMAAQHGRTLPAGMEDVIVKAMKKDANERYASMDELVAALVEVYRNTSGAGMSTYMAAFQPPQSGPMSSQMPHATPSHTPMPYQSQGTPTPMPATPSGSMPVEFAPTAASHQPVPSAGHGAPTHLPVSGPLSPDNYPSSSASFEAPKSGKGGLIAVLLIVLVVGLGAGAFVMFGMGGGDKKDDSKQSVAKNDDSNDPNATDPNAKDPNAKDPNATDPNAKDPNAKDPNATDPNAKDPNAKDPNAKDPNVVDPNATDPNAKDPNATDPNAKDPNATDPNAKDPDAKDPDAKKPAAVTVLLSSVPSGAYVWVDGKKLKDKTPTMVKVTPGTPVDVKLKRYRYHTKRLKVDGSKNKVVARLRYIPRRNNNGKNGKNGNNGKKKPDPASLLE